MREKATHRIMLMFLFLFFGFAYLNAQSEISGQVTAHEDGERLVGVNVLLLGTSIGTVTDLDGNFTLKTNQNPPFDVEVSYIGYTAQTITVTAPNQRLNFRLMEGIVIQGNIVVSASRKAEKIQEAPASISLITGRILDGSPQIDPVRNLINVPGIQIQQQSANRINIEMRASSGIFATTVLPIMDYRTLVGPGTGTFHTDAVGLSGIDLDRIEVVRGPGSALYGPGVTSGVVHFITKNPIDHTGTTIQLGGGTLSTFLSSVRHAWANQNKTFGFKVNASYNRGNEFTLDGSEGTYDGQGNFTSRLDAFKTQIIHPAVTNGMVDLTKPGKVLLTEEDLDPDGDGNMMQKNWFNTSINTTLEFRPQEDLSFFLSGGYNRASSVFYNDLGEGLAQQGELWTQARLQKGGFFAQVFYVDNNGGTEQNPSLLYTSGNRSPIGRKQFEGQLQYNFNIPSLLNADLTIGADYRMALSETFNLVYGRFEDQDDFRLYGAYTQAKFALGDKLSLVTAGRYDEFNILDEGFFSPRLALVYKPDTKNTIRASFNRAGAPPDGIEFFVDFPVNVPIPGVFDFWLVGMNQTHEFGDNPNIEFLNQNVVAGLAGLDPTDPSIAGLLGALPDELPWGTPGLPLALAYGVLSPDVIPLLVGQLNADPITAPLAPAIEQYLMGYTPSGVTGYFHGINAFDGNTPLNQLIATKKPSIVTSNTYELGYKGVISDKLSVFVDIYNVTRKGFNDFTQIAPLISLQQANLANDLGDAVATDRPANH